MLNECRRRWWAATAAQALGHGGQTLRAKVPGMARSTISLGEQAVGQGAVRARPGRGRVRAPGGGRKPLRQHQPARPPALDARVEPRSRGDPQSSLRWTGKRVRHLAADLTGQGDGLGRQQVADLRHALGYRLPANATTTEGAAQPDRPAQFADLTAQVQAFPARGHPGVAGDTQTKELVGECKTGGRQGRPQGEPQAVRVHDFADPHLGTAIP